MIVKIGFRKFLLHNCGQIHRRGHFASWNLKNDCFLAITQNYLFTFSFYIHWLKVWCVRTSRPSSDVADVSGTIWSSHSMQTFGIQVFTHRWNIWWKYLNAILVESMIRNGTCIFIWQSLLSCDNRAASANLIVWWKSTSWNNDASTINVLQAYRLRS